MKYQEMIEETKTVIEHAMMDFIFEPLNNITLTNIENTIAVGMSEFLDMDINYEVTAMVLDEKLIVVTILQDVGPDGHLKLTARYVEDKNAKNDTTETAFDYAMEIVNE